MAANWNKNLDPCHELTGLKQKSMYPCRVCICWAQKTCAQCHTAHYCSKRCQIQDWTTHKKKCIKGTSHKVPVCVCYVYEQPTYKEKSPASARRVCKRCCIISNRRCSSCDDTYYCSLECQQRDWPKHKKQCGSLLDTKKHLGYNAEKVWNKMLTTYASLLSRLCDRHSQNPSRDYVLLLTVNPRDTVYGISLMYIYTIGHTIRSVVENELDHRKIWSVVENEPNHHKFRSVTEK